MRRIILSEPDFGPSGDQEAAEVLGQSGEVLAVFAQPARTIDVATLREAIVSSTFDQDFGDAVIAGVAFAPNLGGDAVAFT